MIEWGPHDTDPASVVNDVDALSRFRGDGLSWREIACIDVDVSRGTWRQWVCAQEAAQRLRWYGGRWLLTALGADFLRGIA
jgi:hypothetical protein